MVPGPHETARGNKSFTTTSSPEYLSNSHELDSKEWAYTWQICSQNTAMAICRYNVRSRATALYSFVPENIVSDLLRDGGRRIVYTTLCSECGSIGACCFLHSGYRIKDNSTATVSRNHQNKHNLSTEPTAVYGENIAHSSVSTRLKKSSNTDQIIVRRSGQMYFTHGSSVKSNFTIGL